MYSSGRAIRAASPSPSGAGSNGWSARDRNGAAPSASPEGYFSPIAPSPTLTRPRPAPGDDPGGDHRDPQPALQRRVEDRAEDDGGLRADLLAHPRRGRVDLEQRHVGAAGDVDQHPARALHRHVVDGRVAERGLGGVDGAALALPLAPDRGRYP